MNNSSEKKEGGYAKAKLLRLILILVEFVILLVLFFIFINYGINPLILLLIMVFILLITIGPTFKKRKKRVYSQMFPDRRRQPSTSSQIRRKKSFRIIYKDKDNDENEKEEEIDEIQPTIYKSISLDIKRNKPIIIKCENCGMIVAGFVKECPKCNEKIYY